VSRNQSKKLKKKKLQSNTNWLPKQSGQLELAMKKVEECVPNKQNQRKSQKK